MHDEADILSAQGLARYLRTSASSSNRKSVPEYDDFLRDVDALFALRMRAEEYWGGSPRGSPHNYIEHRFRAKSADGALPLEWKDIYDELCPPAETPPRRLIVQIALNCTEEVRLIAAGMRRVLSRERVITPIGRAQQIDTHCMRWLMMQPGRTTLEKAGTRQRIMAVVRREQFDTLENRVFKDFVLRCKRLAADYLQMLPEKFKNGENKEVVAVKSLEIACDRVMALPELAQITALPNLPQPNYVLQQDAKYSKIWKMYLKVVEWLRVAERLWQNRNAIAEKVNKLREFSAKRVAADNFLYQSRIWFNPFGKKEDPFDHGVTNLSLANKAQLERRAQQDVAHMIADGIGVIDLTGEDVYGDWLVVGGLHENALPRIQDDTYPLWDDMEQEVDDKRRNDSSVAELSKCKVSELCSADSIYDVEKQNDTNESLTFVDYARCLVGEYRTIAGKDLKELIILSPDDWDVYTQESAIRAFAIMGRDSVYLLWRSIAAALGCEALSAKYLKGDGVLTVVDFRNDGTAVVSALRYLREEESGRLVPQRSVFQKSGEINADRHARFDANEIEKIFRSDLIKSASFVLVTGKIDYNFKLMLPYGASLILEETSPHEVYRFQIGQTSCLMAIEQAEDDWLLHGARRFCKERNDKILYYDEQEPMWIVGQSDDAERIIWHPLVPADERSVGGDEKVIPIPKDLIAIGEGDSGVRFLFHVGDITRNTRLRLYRQELCAPQRKCVHLVGTIRVSPGQGLAITTVNATESGVFEHPVVLDYLKGMKESQHTIAKLEDELPRSYPPVSAKVEAYEQGFVSPYFDAFEIDEIKRYVRGYLSGRMSIKDLPDKLFYHVQNIKEAELVEGESKLRLLDRRNVFGNVPGRMRPIWLTEEDESMLLDKLVEDERRHSKTCRLLIAWTYRGENRSVRSLARRIVEEYKATENQEVGLNHKDGSVSFLANTLPCSGMDDLELETVNVFISRLLRGCSNANDYRLIYNILQFDDRFFQKVEGSGSEAVMLRIVSRLRIRLIECRKERTPTKYKWILRCLLYLLRYREQCPSFIRDAGTYEKRFGRRDNDAQLMAEEYVNMTQALSIAYPNEGEDVKLLRETTLKFLEGSGRLKDIIQIGGNHQ